MTKTISVFNAALQKDTDHTVVIDGNGEIVLTCTEDGSFIKFPKTVTPEQLPSLLEAHKAANLGQVTQASIEAKQAEFSK